MVMRRVCCAHQKSTVFGSGGKGTPYLLLAVAACCLASQTRPVRACQYNVREVGFIDVGIELYRLIVYLPEGTAADQVAGLKQTMSVALAETNIRFEAVTAGADANEAIMAFAKTHGLSRFPAAVLVSPDGQSLPLALPEKAPSLAEAVSSMAGNLLDSPLRRQILEKCAATYGVVLLIEGPDPQRNQAAREAATTAISQIGGQLDSLPKPIGKAPELVVLERKSLADEPLLLWTFRLKAEDVNQPCAAIFYGRGRWIGPVFRGEILTADNLMQLLSMIGADCECTLDHRMLQGTMLPARWDEGLHQKVVQSVGFDPESPMTKMEMISLVRRGLGESDYPAVPFDYQEIQVGGAANEAGEQATADKKQTTTDKEQTITPSSALRSPSSGIVGQVLAGSLVGLAALAGAVSLVIVMRARKS